MKTEEMTTAEFIAKTRIAEINSKIHVSISNLKALIDAIANFGLSCSKENIVETPSGSTPESTLYLLSEMAGNEINKITEYTQLLSEASQH